jgi:polyisoprenoid-binding protein YceI
MKNTVAIFVLIISMLCVCAFAYAESEIWQIDKAHSNIYFDVRHTYATVRGQFDEFSGAVRFDPDKLAMSSVRFEVSTKSINTRIPNRDNHLRSEEFFAVNEYPSMTFESVAVKHTSGDQYILEGNLAIKGKTNKVAIPFTYFGLRENPLKKGQMVAGFETRFSIDRLDYGVGSGKFFKMGVVGNKVDILITLEVLRD